MIVRLLNCEKNNYFHSLYYTMILMWMKLLHKCIGSWMNESFYDSYNPYSNVKKLNTKKSTIF